MKNILFLCSGGGGNMKFIFEYEKLFYPEFQIQGVIADRNCGALEFAINNGVNNHLIKYDRSKKADRNMRSIINNYNPDIIITNLHKIISPSLLKSFGNKFINLHYSFLPAYAGLIGMRAVDIALNNNSKFIGVTSHYLSEHVDRGKIITQGVLPTNRENLYKRVFDCGVLVLLSTILNVLKLPIGGMFEYNDFIINPFSKEISRSQIKSTFDIFNQKHVL